MLPDGLLSFQIDEIPVHHFTGYTEFFWRVRKSLTHWTGAHKMCVSRSETVEGTLPMPHHYPRMKHELPVVGLMSFPCMANWAASNGRTDRVSECPTATLKVASSLQRTFAVFES